MRSSRPSCGAISLVGACAVRCDGDYQQTKGVRSEQPITTGKIRGFRKFDKVRYRGQQYFIKGRMSTGYAILMRIDGKKVDLKPLPKFEKMKRVSARSSWITSQRIMPHSFQETIRQYIESQG